MVTQSLPRGRQDSTPDCKQDPILAHFQEANDARLKRRRFYRTPGLPGRFGNENTQLDKDFQRRCQ